MLREYSLIRFNQFMLLDCAADYTVKQAGGTRRIDSINFRGGDSKWNMGSDGLEVGVLIVVWAPGGRTWHYVLLYLSCISVNRCPLLQNGYQREEVVEMCCRTHLERVTFP